MSICSDCGATEDEVSYMHVFDNGDAQCEDCACDFYYRNEDEEYLFEERYGE